MTINEPQQSVIFDEFGALLAKVHERRQEIDRFEQFLRNETVWLSAPASTRFHLCHPGGLVEHSVNVARVALKLREALAPDISEESCVIAGLYHDLGKVGMPGKPYYLPNPQQWMIEKHGIRYTVNKDLVHMDIASRSLFLLASHIPLSDEEAQAVRYHDGQYIQENRSVAHRETSLTRIIQYADNWAGCELETRGVNSKNGEARNGN